MRPAGRLAVCVVFAGCAAAPALANAAARFDVYAAAWRASSGGTARIDGAARGSLFDLERDAGAGGSATALEAGVWIHPHGRHRLRLSALDLRTAGDGSPGAALSLGGTVIPAGASVSSSYDLRLYGARYAWAFVNLDPVVVSVVGGLDGVDARTAVRSSSGEGSARLRGAAPLIGISALFQPVRFVGVVGEASYAGGGTGGVERVRDLSVRAEFYVARLFGLGLGYRDVEVRADDSGNGAVDTGQRGFEGFVLFRF